MKKWICLLFLANVLSSSTFADTASTNRFALNSTGFLDEGAIPVLYTCDGKDISPEIDWSNLPAKTQSLALILTDPTAPGGIFYHWAIFNIPRTTMKIAEGEKIIPGALLGKNSWDRLQYNGPCPPKGAVHTYVFTLYALDEKLNIPAGTDAGKVEAALQNHIVGSAKITAVYSRWIK